MRQMVVTPDTDWFSDPRPFLGICGQQMHICIPSHVGIHRLGPNEFILID